MLQKIDLALCLPALLLIIIGSVALSSVAPSAFPFHFLYIALSVLAFIFFSNLDTRILKGYSPILYVISIVLLLLTPLFGESVRGSIRWIDLGFVTLQTSEVAKPFMLLFLAYIISQTQDIKRFVLAILITLVPAVIVFTQPDLGSTIILVAGLIGALFIGGLPTRFVTLGIVLALILIPITWFFLAPYQKDRIHSFIDPQSDPLSSGYNSIQAKIAVGGGGLTGQGLGQGTQSQLLFLPERHTDFIFASISEELGFIGSFAIILAFGILLWRMIILIRNTNDLYAQTFLGGLFFVFFVQAAVNIGMNVGLLPITGIPLPFVSSGGSSLLAMSASLGMASAFASLRERGFSGTI